MINYQAADLMQPVIVQAEMFARSRADFLMLRFLIISRLMR